MPLGFIRSHSGDLEERFGLSCYSPPGSACFPTTHGPAWQFCEYLKALVKVDVRLSQIWLVVQCVARESMPMALEGASAFQLWGIWKLVIYKRED